MIKTFCAAFKKALKESYDKMFRRSTQRLYDEIVELEQVIDKYKEELEELKKPDIHIDLVDDSEHNATPKSVRINYFVWEDWQKFCEQNDDYSKKQLLSMALKEFMDKHN